MRHPLVEDTERLTISDVREAIPQDATTATLLIGEEEIAVIGKLTNLQNGYRYVFHCNGCGRPCESLFRRDFAALRCRVCSGLVYASSMKVRIDLPKRYALQPGRTKR